MDGWRPVLARAAIVWLPLAVVTTCVAGLVYAAVQQDIRRSADDPQVQLAEDAASRLDAGAPASGVLPSGTVDMRRSLAPYVMVFDRRRRVLAASAVLDGRGPDFPVGVFDSVPASGEDRITWAPRPEVRSAAVVTTWKGGFVVAGRSLRTAEQREDSLRALVAVTWLAALALSALAAIATAALGSLVPNPHRPGGRGPVGTSRDGPEKLE
jgi:hypothetical protein